MRRRFLLISFIVCTILSGKPVYLFAGDHFPPQFGMTVPGVHSYAELSVNGGDTVHFRTSSTVPYELSICRLGDNIDGPDKDEVLHTFPIKQPFPQSIYPGSYIHIPPGKLGGMELPEGSIEIWVQPWKHGTDQGVFTQWGHPEYAGSWGICFLTNGSLCFYIGKDQWTYDEFVPNETTFALYQWHHLVGTWSHKDGKRKFWVNGQLVFEKPFEGSLKISPTVPIRIGAAGESGQAMEILDGTVAVPAIYKKALTPEEVAARFAEKGLIPASDDDIVASWPLNEGNGSVVKDISNNNVHGRIINHATWMVGGPSFDPNSVDRFDATYDPKNDKTRGHGLRLASDDLVDCRWQITEQYQFPDTARSGFYVGRIRFTGEDGVKYVSHVPIVVKKPKGTPKAPILLMGNSNTWLAYNSTPFPVSWPEDNQLQYGCISGYPNSPGDPPAKSCYRPHRFGQPCYYIGTQKPLTAAWPYVLYSDPESKYSHLLRAERPMQVLLDREGYQYDMATDLDVEQNPGILDGYKVVIIIGHSEYWSGVGYAAFDQYLKNGGNVIVFSGNTLLWRVAFNEDKTVMECRKFNGPGYGGQAPIGEIWHSGDGKRGSFLRECGLMGADLFGLEWLLYSGSTPITQGLYRVEMPDHFLFNVPEKVGLAKGELFGGEKDPNLGPKAVGHETDVRLSTLVSQFTFDAPPPGGVIAKEPEGINTLAVGIATGDFATRFDYFFRIVPSNNEVFAELIYWERPQGGKVINSGSIGTGFGLLVDKEFQTFFRNALHHFGVVK
ncbi:MAG: hypothetical protein FWD31_01715 [Planctomycetaceae bacterium]|nr:hypothetical protein [Planctomycetaceae bacterium]